MTSAREQRTVIVVGGGPVGLAIALELDLHGIPVTVIEPRQTVEASRPRAKTTTARTMEFFRRWGVADRVRERAGLPADWSRRISFATSVTGREITHFDDVLGLQSADAGLSAEAAQQVTQPVIEEVLRERIASRDGVQLLLGWRAVAVRQDDSSATVTIEDSDGERHELASDWIIGADGARSVVRTAMGAKFEGAAGGRPNVNITFRSQQLAARIPLVPSIHYWVLNPEAPGVVGPLDLDGIWWAISTGTESISGTEEAEKIVAGLLGADDIDIEVLATDPWQARLLLADSYRAGRLFIVGDAAHQNPPWGGHGFNTGVGDAMNLGWKLAAVIRGWAPDALLDSYERERRPIAAQTIEVAAGNMRALPLELADSALMGDGADADAARARAAAVVQATKDAEFHADGLVLGYGYTGAAAEQSTTLAEYRPIAAAGNRLPHLMAGNGRPLIDLLGPGFSAIGPAELIAPLAAAARARGIPFETVDRDGPVILVRPDQHIAWAGAAVDDPDGILTAALTGFAGSGADQSD